MFLTILFVLIGFSVLMGIFAFIDEEFFYDGELK
jgi:hypothetical protein